MSTRPRNTAQDVKDVQEETSVRKGERLYDFVDDRTGETLRIAWGEKWEPTESDIEYVFNQHRESQRKQGGQTHGPPESAKPEKRELPQSTLEGIAKASQPVQKKEQSEVATEDLFKPLSEYPFHRQSAEAVASSLEYGRVSLQTQRSKKLPPISDEDRDAIGKVYDRLEAITGSEEWKSFKNTLDHIDTEIDSFPGFQQYIDEYTEFARVHRQELELAKLRERAVEAEGPEKKELIQEFTDELQKIDPTRLDDFNRRLNYFIEKQQDPEVQTGLKLLSQREEIVGEFMPMVQEYTAASEELQKFPHEALTVFELSGERLNAVLDQVRSRIEDEKQRLKEDAPRGVPVSVALAERHGVRVSQEERQRRQNIDLAEKFVNLASIDGDIMGVFQKLEQMPDQLFPFLRSISGWAENAAILRAYNKQDKGEKLDGAEKVLLDAWQLSEQVNQVRPESYLHEVFFSAFLSAPWMAEMYALSWPRLFIKGAVQGGVKAGLELMKKGHVGNTIAQRLVSVTGLGRAERMTAIRELVKSAPGSPSIQRATLGSLAGTLAQGTVGGAFATGDEYTRRLLMGDSPGTAFSKAYLLTLAEHAGQLSGGPMRDWHRAIKMRLFAKGAKGKTPSMVKSDAEVTQLRMAWNGFWPEVAEEEIIAASHAVIEGEPFHIPFLSKEGTDRLAMEASVIGTIQAVMTGVPRLGRIAHRGQRKLQRKIALRGQPEGTVGRDFAEHAFTVNERMDYIKESLSELESLKAHTRAEMNTEQQGVFKNLSEAEAILRKELAQLEKVKNKNVFVHDQYFAENVLKSLSSKQVTNVTVSQRIAELEKILENPTLGEEVHLQAESELLDLRQFEDTSITLAETDLEYYYADKAVVGPELDILEIAKDAHAQEIALKIQEQKLKEALERQRKHELDFSSRLTQTYVEIALQQDLIYEARKKEEQADEHLRSTFSRYMQLYEQAEKKREQLLKQAPPGEVRGVQQVVIEPEIVEMTNDLYETNRYNDRYLAEQLSAPEGREWIRNEWRAWAKLPSPNRMLSNGMTVGQVVMLNQIDQLRVVRDLSFGERAILKEYRQHLQNHPEEVQKIKEIKEAADPPGITKPMSISGLQKIKDKAEKELQDVDPAKLEQARKDFAKKNKVVWDSINQTWESIVVPYQSVPEMTKEERKKKRKGFLNQIKKLEKQRQKEAEAADRDIESRYERSEIEAMIKQADETGLPPSQKADLLRLLEEKGKIIYEGLDLRGKDVDESDIVRAAVLADVLRKADPKEAPGVPTLDRGKPQIETLKQAAQKMREQGLSDPEIVKQTKMSLSELGLQPQPEGVDAQDIIGAISDQQQSVEQLREDSGEILQVPMLGSGNRISVDKEGNVNYRDLDMSEVQDVTEFQGIETIVFKDGTVLPLSDIKYKGKEITGDVRAEFLQAVGKPEQAPEAEPGRPEAKVQGEEIAALKEQHKKLKDRESAISKELYSVESNIQRLERELGGIAIAWNQADKKMPDKELDAYRTQANLDISLSQLKSRLNNLDGLRNQRGELRQERERVIAEQKKLSQQAHATLQGARPGAQPDVEGAPKAPHEMTKTEYRESKRKGAEVLPVRTLEREHGEYVRQALAEGKVVPPEVLKDYPDLQPPPPPKAPKPELSDSPDGSGPLISEVKSQPDPGVTVQTVKRYVNILKSGAGDVTTMPAQEIAVDAKRFQFKLLTDAKGVTAKLKDVKVFDPMLGGVILGWIDPQTGDTFVINGHHRVELAQRLNYTEPLTVLLINAQNDAEARTSGALVNIAEGQGTAIDAAKLFRDSGLTKEDLADRGISLRGTMVRDGLALARLNNAIFGMVARAQMGVQRGVIIGERLSDHQLQNEVMVMIDKHEKRGKNVLDEHVVEMADDVSGAPTKAKASDQTKIKFEGEKEVETESLAFEVYEVKRYVKTRLGKERRLFDLVSKSKNAELLINAGNVINIQESANVSREAAMLMEFFDRFKNTAPISTMLKEAAKRIGDGENANSVRKETYDRVTEVIPQIIAGVEGQGVAKSPQSVRDEKSDVDIPLGFDTRTRAEEAVRKIREMNREVDRLAEQEKIERDQGNERVADKLMVQRQELQGDIREYMAENDVVLMDNGQHMPLSKVLLDMEGSRSQSDKAMIDNMNLPNPHNKSDPKNVPVEVDTQFGPKEMYVESVVDVEGVRFGDVEVEHSGHKYRNLYYYHGGSWKYLDFKRDGSKFTQADMKKHADLINDANSQDLFMGAGFGAEVATIVRGLTNFFKDNGPPLDGVTLGNTEFQSLWKKHATGVVGIGKLIRVAAVPMWVAEKYPGFGDIIENGRIVKKGIWGTIDRHLVRDMNLMIRMIEKDILNDYKDLEALNSLDWKQINNALKDLNEINPIERELTEAELRKAYKFSDQAMRGYMQIRSAFDAGLQTQRKLDRYKIVRQSNFEMESADFKKINRERVKAHNRFHDDVMTTEQLRMVDGILRQEGKLTEKQMKLLWQFVPVREALADVLINEKYDPQYISNYFSLTRPTAHRYLVAAKNYLASFATHKEAAAHAREQQELGRSPARGEKTIRIIDIQEQPLPDHYAKQLTENQLYELAEDAGISARNDTIVKLAKELKGRGFSKHFIGRNLVPGFQYNKVNVLKNVKEYYMQSLRRYHKHVAFAEAESILREEKRLGTGRYVKMPHPETGKMAEFKVEEYGPDGAIKTYRDEFGRKHDATPEQSDAALPETAKMPPHIMRYAEAYLASMQVSNPVQLEVLRQAIYTRTLGLSVSNFLQNLTQSIQATYNEIPILLKAAGVKTPFLTEKIFVDAYGMAAKFNLRKAGKKMKKGPKVEMPAEFLEWAEVGRREGILNPLHLEALIAMGFDPAEKYPTGTETTSKIKRGWNYYVQTMALGQKMSEVINRDHAYFAGMIIGQKYHGLKGRDLHEFAVRLVQRTQFTFGKHNLPQAVTGFYGSGMANYAQAVGRLGYILRGFSFNYMGRLADVARSGVPGAIGRNLAGIFTLAGVRGLPHAGLGYAFYNFVSQMLVALGLTDDPEPPELKERRAFGAIEKRFGLPHRFLTTGPIGSTLGIETHRLVGSGHLLPTRMRFSDLYGVAANLGRDARTMGQGIIHRDPSRIIRSAPVVPRAISNLTRAQEAMTEGVVVSGRVLIHPDELTRTDRTKLQTGFTPTRFSDAYEKSGVIRKLSTFTRNQYNIYLNQYVRAITREDDEALENIIESIAAYNERMPSRELEIDTNRLRMEALYKAGNKLRGRRFYERLQELDTIY